MNFDTGTDRLEIFSDAVIAIAITLLVLDIKVPTSKDGQLVHDLLQKWPSHAAYVLSFAVIAIMWVGHHSMFERIAPVDRGLLFLNLLLLLGIGFLPFPTALLAEYTRQGGSNSHAAAAIYTATTTLIGLAFLAIWLRLARHPDLLSGSPNTSSVRRSINLSLVSPVVYGATIGLAFVSAEACFVVSAVAALYFAFGPSSRALSRRLERQTEAPPVTAAPLATAGDAGVAVSRPGREPLGAVDVAVPTSGPGGTPARERRDELPTGPEA